MSLMRLSNRGGLRPRVGAGDLQDEFDRLFENFGGGLGLREEQFTPAVDVRETDDAYVVEADIPGMRKEDVSIEVADNTLSITGERKSEREEKRKDYHRVEREFGSFRRAVSIPGGFGHKGVEAQFKDGVLTVTLPKPEEAKPRRIEVNAK